MGIRTRRAHKHASTHAVGFGIAGVFGFIALFALALAVSLGAVVDSWLQDLPDYESADAYLVAEPTIVYAADGTEIAEYYLQNRRSVTLDDISDYVKKGTVDVEDERFYQHNGVDPQGILRAIASQLSGRSEGASTITQQLVRNTVLSSEQFDQTLKRKVREAYIAIQMEKTYSKDQILNMYLNTIYYGEGAYGIEAASVTYFNKHASELTLAEAATLVGIPNSPSYYDPFVNPDACVERRNKVLGNMLEMGDITQDEYNEATAEELTLSPGSLQDEVSGSYPYFTDYVKQLLQNDFDNDTILKGGLRVYTTLEVDKQQAADEAVNDLISKSGNDQLSAALVSVDNTNGHIVAMVGGTNYGYDETQGQSSINLAISQRQAGSSFKPFMLMAAMIDGMNPSIILNCNSPMQITSTWTPHNYENAQYGYVSLARATELSSNTAYAQVVMAVGVDKLIETAHLMGIDSDLSSVPSLVLGSSGVTPLEMCEAYSVFATNGVHRDAIAITKIEDRNGNTVYEHEDDPKQVIDEGVAQDARKVLEGVVKAGYTTNYVHANFTANQPVGGKTGTSDKADNLWFCGFTPQLTTTVWCGNRDNNQAAYYKGALASTPTTAQPIWTNYMNTVLKGVDREEFPVSTETVTYKDNSSWSFVGTSASTNSGSSWNTVTDNSTSNSTRTESTTSTTTEKTETNTNNTETNSGTGTGGNGGNGNGGNGGNGQNTGTNTGTNTGENSNTGTNTGQNTGTNTGTNTGGTQGQ
ncbi:penicillin-binding protein, 1A family [Olsenella sp. KH3B4]|uniref:transglycosylase domain-containing protein n=1 Tax=Olsenella sp. KH3B4 TaxID=1855394 RepID=UPI0008C8052B|nr:PBP1A family penicillin-binding protein [Olsenella sp. KH3B4]SES85536.1 penicillin-binding protein, 1A family [Olsenella sp. KH3B4]